jgi:glycosyltransferase involved in cell wall biosynthesis
VISIARHAGLPSLVTPVGGLAEQVENGRSGFLAAGTDPASIARAIEAVVASPTTYAQISTALLADDSDANWARAADGIVAFLRNGLADRAR